MSRPRILCAVLALTTLLVYLPAWHNGFVNYDDPDYVTQNPVVQTGLTWPGVKWAFTTTSIANWHPLTWLSLMLDYQLFGLDAGGYHLVNVLFHTANSALLFLLLLRLTGACWSSAVITALFAWHPLRVESVAWVAERKDVLSAFFAFLTLLAYVRYAQKRGPATALNGTNRKAAVSYCLALIFFAFGLMAKPMLVTLPFVFLLLDYWPLQRSPNFELRPLYWLRLVGEKWPFFALAAASCVVTYHVQQHSGATAPLERFPLSARFENGAVAYVKYLFTTVCPIDLAVIYPMPKGIALGKVFAAMFGLALVSRLVWRVRVSKPYLATGWLWYLGMLLPVIGVVQVGSQAMADRYTYLPQIGLFIGVVFGLRELAKKLRMAPALIIAVVAIVLAGCLFATEHQLRYWRDSETLFEHALAVTKDNFVAQNNLGIALSGAGRPKEAIEHIRESLRLYPNNASAHDNLGIAFTRTGQLQEAIEQYQEALRLEPDSVKAHDNLGNALLQIGALPEAVEHYQEALRLNPNDSSAHHNLGVVLLQTGHPDEAVEHFREALRLKPDDVMTYNSLGVALDQTGHPQEAIQQYQKALRFQPNSPETHCDLGITLTETGHTAEAISNFQQALQGQPNFLQAHYGLGQAFLQKGQVDKAINQFRLALQLQPEFTPARDGLTNALLQQELQRNKGTK